MIRDLISQLMMLEMIRRLARTQTRMMMEMRRIWMWCDTKWILVALFCGTKSEILQKVTTIGATKIYKSTVGNN